MSDTELLSCFESIGFDCEFGVVQRYAAVESLDLFRYASVSAPAFVSGVESRFEGLTRPEAVEIFRDENTNEWLSRVEPHGFIFHTGFHAQRDPVEHVRQHHL